ncbi:MAG: GatB/YqeY domain-containing protein [Oligoflexales bacterium]|nr:GatB/YqeY domain-containing protein [Oligoflexales bacterium]
MDIKETLTEEMKTAMRAKDKERLTVIRMLLSEFKYLDVQLREKNKLASNDDYIAAVESYAKKIQKSIVEMPDRAADLEKEMAIINSFLPTKANKEEILPLVEAAILASADKNFGKIMQQVAVQLGARADKPLISLLIKERLG